MFALQTSLRRRMIATLAITVTGVVAVGIAAAMAVNGLHEDLGLATAGYRELQNVYTAGFLASKARDAMSATPPSRAVAESSLRAAAATLEHRDGTGTPWLDEQSRVECRALAARAADDAAAARPGRSMDLLFARLAKVTVDVRNAIADAQTAADNRRRSAVRTVAEVCTTVTLFAVVLGLRQYWRVIRPLQRIGQGVQTFAAGNLDLRIDPAGDREFARLAVDFNRMADELRNLYRDLERQVQAKSRELVRAERLASVGFLAAGVAHEINNPLGIIAGYGERALRQLPADAPESTHKALTVMCEEAFRCKQITERLLSLSRPGSDERSIVSMSTIAEKVVSTVTGLRGDRRIDLHAAAAAQTRVVARSGELEQVLLNLLLNATEAVEAGGRVVVNVEPVADAVQMTVTDDGRGMSRASVEKVFEPFFTDKRGVRTGTGLGLSIVHAIVTDHGGTATAASDGPGRGSRFTISLPVALEPVD